MGMLLNKTFDFLVKKRLASFINEYSSLKQIYNPIIVGNL